MNRAWLCAVSILTLIGSLDASAQPRNDPDWPCIQILVPRVSAAMIWNGPSVENLDWQSDTVVRDAVFRITAPGNTPEQAVETLTTVTADWTEDQREERLVMLFAGVLETLNRRRSELIRGIKRYARDQRERAEQLERNLAELSQLRDDSSAQAQREELQKQLEWSQRIFDRRQRSIRALCERPVELEITLGEVARAVAARL